MEEAINAGRRQSSFKTQRCLRISLLPIGLETHITKASSRARHLEAQAEGTSVARKANTLIA